MEVSITPTGEVTIEGHTVGHVKGLLFVPDTTANDLEAKTVHSTAALELAPEIDRRLIQIAGSDHAALSLSDFGEILWGGAPIGTIALGKSLLTPTIDMIGGELGSTLLRDQTLGRMQDYLRMEISQKFESLLSLKTFAEDDQSFEGARALAQILYDNHGAIERLDHMQAIKDTDRIARGYIRNKSGQFGFHQVFLRDLLKPAPARLMSLLFAFAWNKDGGGHKHPFLPLNGLASTPDDASYSEATLNKAGYTRKGARIIRFDILARLAQMVLLAIEKSKDKKFRIAQEMLAILGCNFEEFQSVLKAIGYKKTSVEMSPEEFEAEKSIVENALPSAKPQEETSDTARQQKDAADPDPSTETADKNDGVSKDDTSKNTATTNKDTATTKPIKPKRGDPDKILTVYRPRPEVDAEENPIYATSIEYWQRDYSKKFFKPTRQREEPDSSEEYSRSTSTHRKPRPNKLSGYANMKPSKGKANTSRSSKPKTWTAQPDKKSKPSDSQSSPFAALAGLKFSEDTKKSGSD